jgi:hypothetical protein
MLKNIIIPVQAWLLSQKRCVGCGTPLAKGTKTKKKQLTTITCKCKRVYVFSEENKAYRRALHSEI